MKRLLSYILFLTLICASPAVFAQIGLDDPSVDDPAVPIDGGLSLLLAAGAAYGVRRVRRSSKREDGTKP